MSRGPSARQATLNASVGKYVSRIGNIRSGPDSTIELLTDFDEQLSVPAEVGLTVEHRNQEGLQRLATFACLLGQKVADFFWYIPDGDHHSHDCILHAEGR